MQVTNNLQIPVEVLLHSESAEAVQEKLNDQEESKVQRRSTMKGQEGVDFSLIIIDGCNIELR